MKKLLIVAAMAATSTSAIAATSSNPVVAFSGNRAEVCEVRNFDPTINFGNLGNVGNTGSKSDNLDLFCNVRFDATIASQNGFLQLQTLVAAALPTSQSNHTAQGYAGFSSALDYNVSTVLGTANSGSIDPGPGNAITLGTLLPPINVNTTITYDTLPEAQPLLGGTYQDTLTLTITPQSF